MGGTLPDITVSLRRVPIGGAVPATMTSPAS